MADDQLQLGEGEGEFALRQAWQRALDRLAHDINKASFESWIRPIQPLKYDDGRAELGVGSTFARDWLRRYEPHIRCALEQELSEPLEIHFVVGPVSTRPPLGDPDATLPAAQPEGPPPARAKAAVELPELPSMPLNPAYTFDSFVVGRSNRLAQAGAMAVAHSPGQVYNPLFIYGSPGLGKTHLLHAIGNAARALDSGTRVAVVDGENFTQHFVTALRERRVEEFKRRYRSIDLWLVDDIQFIAGKEQTKEEFFHTFNALYQTGRQIVIASDRSPSELRSLDERLRSRFQAGLIADVHPPDVETREEIIDRRCAEEHWQLSLDVRRFIARSVRSNIRALQGALTRLVAYSSVMNTIASIDVAHEALAEFLADAGPVGRSFKDVPVELIIRTVAEAYGTTPEALTGQRRDAATSRARQVAMLLCRELSTLSLAQIGSAFGGRDHTTVQRAIAKLEGLIPYDRALHSTLDRLRHKLGR